MAENTRQSGGRAIITQAEADAISAKAGIPQRARVGRPQRDRLKMNRRELLSYATAGSLAVMTAIGLGTMLSPNQDDELIQQLPGEGAWIPGGFAYPRIKAGEFGGKFILGKAPEEYGLDAQPELNASGKFFVVRIPTTVETNDGFVGLDLGDGTALIAIYQVCTHLGCLIPFQAAENRFICPCHGSTFQRESVYVLGPAPRNLDQFPVALEEGLLIVDTGKKATGLTSQA